MIPFPCAERLPTSVQRGSGRSGSAKVRAMFKGCALATGLGNRMNALGGGSTQLFGVMS